MDFVAETPYTLYYALHSICSTMVRLTYVLRGSPKDGSPDIEITSKEINIGNGNEQLTEKFLCDINKEGVVPVLVNGNALSAPLPESQEITYFLCDRFPQLLPEKHATLIKQLITELHNISFYSLTFGLMPATGLATQIKINEILQDPNISERYRSALLYKKAQRLCMEEEIVPGKITENEKLARTFNDKVEVLFRKYNPDGPGKFIFGSSPTALDAHTICFLARLYDKKRTYLIPHDLLEYVKYWRGTDEWKSILPHISTIPDFLS